MIKRGMKMLKIYFVETADYNMIMAVDKCRALNMMYTNLPMYKKQQQQP